MRQVSKPDRVGVVARNSPDFIDTILRITEQGHVAAILRFHDDTERSSLASVNMIVDPERSGGWLERQFTPRRDDAIAQISFTSGTEGAPKAVLLSHRALTDVTDRLQTLMSLDNSVREYIGVPVYHSFGFGRCRSVCAAGGKAYVPASGLQVPELVTMLKAGLINAISAVPSQWRLLLSHKDLLRPYGDRIRWIEIGSQYMSGDEKEQLRLLFQNAKIIQHYGLTEASRATLLEIHKEDREQLESVGRAIGEVEVKTEADGRICVRGPLLASGMLVGGREVSITDAEGWFKTNDLGYFRDNYLHFLGRADDVINCGGIKLYPETLERRMHQMLGTDQGFAITKTVDQIRGDGILYEQQQ
jgi:acyl-CoA synthetase (AMP-forming)/AMP-acid ligase II